MPKENSFSTISANIGANVRGVILAAGYGSRFLPATKSIPKEIFPLIDTPVIDFIVREMIDSGIEDILIITSRRKKSLEDYFDREYELERAFSGSSSKLEKIKPCSARIQFVRQKEMLGTADALSLAQCFTGSSPFVVAFPDDLVFAQTPLSKQLIQVYRDSGKSVLAVKDLAGEDVSRYGVIDPFGQTGDNVFRVRGIVEKPKAGSEPSSLVSLGRYLFTPEVFGLIEDLRAKKKGIGEFYQTDVINELASKDRVLALDFEGTRYDTGEPQGYLQTIVDYALSHPQYRDEFRQFLNTRIAPLRVEQGSSSKPFVRS